MENESYPFSGKPSSKKDNAYPEITLPKGGGAIKSIDDKFSVNAANGTAGVSIPFPFSPSRNGFLPGMGLSYGSGNGNGPFGLGWNAAPPAIMRKTEKKLPRYNDADESDIFIFSGAEDLVPVYKQDQGGNWIKDSLTTDNTTIARYRPRIESGFARIEKITEPDGNIYWKVTTGANIVSIFGRSRSAQLTDPSDPTRIYKWLFEFSYDDKGNCYQFGYKQEDKINIPASLHEKNRLNDFSPCANLYLKRIKYANKLHFDRTTIPTTTTTPTTAPASTGQDWDDFLSGIEYLLELVLDYGEHDPLNPQPTDDKGWPSRTDPFSDYKAGFEIRTWRLCQRLLMFHHFTELGPLPCMVRSVDLGYKTDSAFSFLTSITQKGYIRHADGSYSQKSMPPIEFGYEQLGWNTAISTLPAASMENLPTGIDDGVYQWVDLYNEGISGILTEQAGAWYYKSNSGDGNLDGMHLVASKPSLQGLSAGALHIQDLEAKGQKFLVSNDLHGYYELGDDNEWQPFKNFTGIPNIDPRDPNLKYLDLDGDGMADILISEEEVFTWYASKGKNGYESHQTIQKTFDEEKGPAIVFADSTQSIILADMSGDGLMDIVRIRYSEVAYWPNLGYGKFGAKVSMSNAPLFDNPENFHPKYLRLADIDGSGTPDLVYLGHDSFKIWFNQGGNSWSETNLINGINPLPFPKTDDHSSVNIIDLLGNGTGCILWSSPLPQQAGATLYYIDLMGGKKPHILTSYKNNMGKETTISYKPSTFFYLADKKAGTPWVTTLPFPVQCVSQTETTDQVRKTRFTNQYAYHHGYYDHAEREFRGFGRVDQTDTEEDLPQPPVLTKTWYHTGAFLDKEKIFTQFAHEYYQNSSIPEYEPTDPPLPADLGLDEWREALRACKGITLHAEVYSPDGSEQAAHPYTTAHNSCLVQLLQPRLHNPYAVFTVQQSEVLTYTYERNPADPRIAHTMTIEVNEFGNVLKAASIRYGRKTTDPALLPAEQAEQNKTHIIFSENGFTDKIDTPADYHLPVDYDARTFELTGLSPLSGDYFSIGQLKNDVDQAVVIPYEASPTPGTKEKRMIEEVKNIFLKNDLSGPLDPGVLESLALPYQSFKLSLTPTLRDAIFGNKVTDTLLLNEGRYVHFGDGNYWIASGTQTFDAQNFYQPIEMTDPLGSKAQIQYDAAYRFFIQKTTDALDNISSVVNFNFRTLSPYLVMNNNDNRSGVRTDELGMVTASFVMGKANENKGDLMDTAVPEASPNDQPLAVLEYDLFNYKNNGKPNLIKTTTRETHYSDSQASGQPVILQTGYAYFDGNGQSIMQKVQAEPGLALQENGDGTVTQVDTTPNLRWIGNGRTILNNKGKPVKQYEPYFSTTPGFEDAQELVERGVTPIIYYDSAGRVTRNDLPDGTFAKVEFDAWMQRSFDQNDTVTDSQWYKDRITAPIPAIATPEEINAATKAAAHANTPATTYLDSLGRAFLTIADNGPDGKYKTVSRLDIEGNLQDVTDAAGNKVLQCRYDMLGARLWQINIDSGERWTINDVMGKPLRTWDSRGHQFRYEYDSLHRPVKMFMQDDSGKEIATEKTIYGETLPDGKTNNLRGIPYQHCDAAGIVTTAQADFKGNLLAANNQLLKNYKGNPDWNILTPDDLEPTLFATSATFDALNRPLKMQLPDNSVVRPVYNVAGILDQVYVSIKGQPETQFVKDISYDAKGQRESIIYGNDTKTNYQYDPKTFRVTQILTTRKNGTDLLQKLTYTYDPMGNISFAKDQAQQTIFFNNNPADPSCDYIYDAIYRLTNASGREHIGQNKPVSAGDESRINLPMPGDGAAMRNYTQRYEYDAVGNILQMIHSAGAGSWTRTYAYETTSHRLKSTTVNDTTENYTYDPHGSILSLSNLNSMTWNFKDELQEADLGGGGIAYYVYNASGQRIRKIIERQGGIVEQRIYLGGFELYQKKDGAGKIQEATETLHIMDGARLIALVETKTTEEGVPLTMDNQQQLIRYQYSNHQGSSSLELDENAVIISYEEYHPYGTTAYQAMNATIKAAAKRYRYTGMERDEESGLEYHSARYYLPWLGRWLSADPIGIEGGLNLYAYTGDNPVNRTDTKGTDWKEDIFGDMNHAAVTQTKYGYVSAKGVLISYDQKNHPSDKIFVPFGQKDPTYIFTQEKWFKITSISGENVSYESVEGSSLWIRINGLVEMVGGALGAAAGVTFGVATAETGVGPVAGAAFATWSVDHSFRGAHNLWTGKEGRTFTARILSNGMSDGTADATDNIAYFILSFVVSFANAKLPTPRIPGGGGGGEVALKSPGGKTKSWFRFWNDEGGETMRVNDNGQGYYSGPRRWAIGKGYRAAIRNRDTDMPGPWAAARDTHFHETFHAFIMKYLPAYHNLAWARIGPVEVGAPLRYLDEVGAYAFGHIMTGRLHALPVVPFEALGSLTNGQLAVMGVIIAGGMTYGGYSVLTYDNDKISVPGSP